MNVPASIPATANSILAQHRTKPSAEFRDATQHANHYTIPPMSMVFATDGSKDHVRNVAAHVDCFAGVTEVNRRRRFRGVSMAGIMGAEAVRFRNNGDRLTIITRGEATIMVPYDHVKNISLGSWVKVKDNDKKKYFRDFQATPTFSIEGCNNCDEAIGKLIRKPDRRGQENWATVCLV